MKNNKPVQPLYKVLNEQRLQNELFASANGIGIYDADKKGTYRFLDYNSNGLDFMMVDTMPTDVQIDATFEYTALAVNNLHILAEAIETVKSVLESWDNTTNQAKYRNLIFHLENALSHIS